MCEAIYDSASPAAELLAEKGALPYRHVARVPDYFAELPETRRRRAACWFPKDGAPQHVRWRPVAMRTMSTQARREGIAISTGIACRK